MSKSNVNQKNEKTLVLGATEKPDRYAFMAVNNLLEKDFIVIALGNKKGFINNQEIITQTPEDENIHTVTIYLSAKNQLPYYNYLQSLSAKRYIFNPGTENNELENLLKKQGKEVLIACTLVMLSTNQY